MLAADAALCISPDMAGFRSISPFLSGFRACDPTLIIVTGWVAYAIEIVCRWVGHGLKNAGQGVSLPRWRRLSASTVASTGRRLR